MKVIGEYSPKAKKKKKCQTVNKKRKTRKCNFKYNNSYFKKVNQTGKINFNNIFN